MKTPREWEDWCDAVWMIRKEYPTWHELITAIQEDACGTSQSKSTTEGFVERLVTGWTSPDYGQGASPLSGQSPSHDSEPSSGSAGATAARRRKRSAASSRAGQLDLADTASAAPRGEGGIE